MYHIDIRQFLIDNPDKIWLTFSVTKIFAILFLTYASLVIKITIFVALAMGLG